MTVSQAPLSVRNNNPGNLRFVGQEGASPGEGGFARFESPEAGLAAMRNQIELDTQTRGLTLTQFINKYAPPSENKTGNYIDFVVKRTGLDPAGRVPVERIADLQTAMIEMEGGPRALDVFKLQPAKPTAVAKAPEIRMAETRTTQPVAFRGQNLPQSYTTALALNYIADTDPDSKIMEQVNQMMQEMQGGGGNARQIAAALKPLTAEEPEVDPFAIMAQAQQAQAQEDAQRRRVVPRMPVRMANGGSMDKSLLELAAMGQKPYYTAEEKAWIAAREKEYEDYNRQVEDYNRKLEQYKKDAEEYNKAVAPYLSEVEAYNQALKRYQEEVYAPYESEVQSYNKALEDYKANVYNPYLSEIEKYNQALEEYEQNVYNPYVKRVEEYNKALEEYNQQNYPGYDKAVADYNKAAEDYNARLKAYEEYTAKAPEYYIGATAENPVPYVISWNPKYDGYFRAYQGFDPLNPGQLSGSPVQYWADWARGGTPGWSRIPTDYEFVQTATVPVYGEKGNFAAGYFRKTGAPAYGSVTSPGEFTLTAPTAPTPYPVAAPTAPDPFGQAEPTKPEDFNRVAPVQPSPFSMTQPTAPSVTSPLQPTQPGTPQYTQEQFEEYVTGAQGRAKKAAAQRASALSIAANPEQYGLSGFGLSLPFEAGGEVNKADLEAKGEVTITPQQREEYFRNLDQALMRMQMSAGDLSGQLVRTPTGIDVRATTNVAGVRPFVDIDPGRLTVSRYGASYGQMSPQGGYDITVQQQASVPTPVGPVNLPPSLRGTYVRPIGKDATVMVEGTYSPGPQPFYQVGGRYVKRFEKGGAVEQNPADIAEQMTVGTIPEGKSGVLGNVARDVVRGAQYLPYDILGAPVDIATMAMRPFGYNVEKPVGGSEYLIEKARQAGIAQAPTGSMAETATRIGMGFVNPAAVARQIPKGIAALEKGAETLGTGAVRAITGKPDITPEQIYQAMGDTKGILQLGAPAAVKPGGGVVNADEMIDSLTNVLKFEVKAEGQKFDDIFKWIDTKARSYYEKQFGAPGDPLFRAFMSGDFEPQFKHINDAVRETYESTIKHGRDLMSSTSTADQRVGRAMLSDVYDKVTPVIAQYGPQTIRNRLLNPKFREEIQRYIMEERNLGPAKLTPKARLNYEKEIDSYLDEFAKTGNLSTKAPFDVTDINMAASQNIVDDIGNKVSIQTIKAYNLQPDEMHGFVRQWPGYGTALEKTHALPSAYSKNYPDYLATTAERQAIKFGEPTYSISKQPEEVHADLRNLIGYLNRTPSDEWKNTSFPDLVVKAQKDYSNITDPQEIYKRLNNYQKVTPKQRLIGTQEFMPVESKQLGEGATWRELDENGILIEGRLLRHCLSEDEKYRNFYKNGMSRFFALRDKEGKSYATIQIDRLGMDGPFANVHQIKGWKNDSVGKKYDKELMDFLNRYQANEINVPLRYTEESSFLPLSLAGGERVRVVEGDAPLVLQYVEFFRTLDRNLIDRGMATPEDLGDFNYVLDRIRDLPTEAQQKEFADTFLKAFAEGYNKPLKFIYHLGGWRTGQLGEPQPVWQNPPVNRAKGGMVDKPLYDRAA